MTISIAHLTFPSPLVDAAYRLRHEVFVGEQNVEADREVDEHDQTAIHFVALHDDEVVGTLRIIQTAEHAKIGRVAVKRAYRRQGIARRLIKAAMDHCRSGGIDRFYLAAQADKLALYEGLGFKAFGPRFLDIGVPHQAMRNY